MTKHLLIAITFIFSIIGSTVAQDEKIDRNEKKYEEYSYSLYINVYQKRLSEKPEKVKDEVLFKLANSYYFIADYENAAVVYDSLYMRSKKKSTLTIPPEVYFRYAQSLRAVNKKERAEEMLRNYVNGAANSDAIFQKLRDFDVRNADKIFDNIRAGVNIKNYSDFAPSFYKDGLIFSSDRDTGNLAKYRHTWNGRDFLDLYKVNVDSMSKNRVAKLNLDEGFTSRVHESTSIFPNDSTMYFTGTNFVDGRYKRDSTKVVRLKLFMAELVDKEWKVVTDPKRDVFSLLNKDNSSFAHPALSADQQTLYFVSDMIYAGAQGSSDIYMASFDPVLGKYKNPVNLGNKVNTKFRETFPFVGDDNNLYFATDGQVIGLGGLDIFSIPLKNKMPAGNLENLGEGVNSSYDDFSFILSDFSKKGFFASNRPTETNSKSKKDVADDDIYAFTYKYKPECVNPKLIDGIVYDRSAETPLSGATVTIIDDNNDVIASTITNAEGKYSISIDRRQNNFVRASREGYIANEEYLKSEPCELRSVDLYLEPDCVSTSTDLAKFLGLDPTIFFDFDKSVIKNDYKDELDIIVTAMELYPSLKIKVNSHTDSRGDNDTYNQPLSERRAKSTVDYIVSKGIDKSRLRYEGFGETKLVNNCKDGVKCSRDAHQKNRRSEFIIDCEEGERCCY